MVEVIKIPDPPGMKKRNSKLSETKKKNEYASENILRTKYDRRKKTDIHCPQSYGFLNVSDDQWNKIFKKEKE